MFAGRVFETAVLDVVYHISVFDVKTTKIWTEHDILRRSKKTIILYIGLEKNQLLECVS